MNIALMPLSPPLHVGALQHLYRATPTYWQLYHYATVPAGQAASDMRNAATMPGRYLMGVVQPTQPVQEDNQSQIESKEHGDRSNKDQAGELIGLVDFRLDWPDSGVVNLGMLMIAERYQRLGLGTAAWQLLSPWLAESAQMKKVRLGVEQFNPNALQFFESLGFQLTGEANRIKVGERLVRLLYLETSL